MYFPKQSGSHCWLFGQLSQSDLKAVTKITATKLATSVQVDTPVQVVVKSTTEIKDIKSGLIDILLISFNGSNKYM